MPNPTNPNPVIAPPNSDILHGQPHPPLSAEAVAKAVARHKREHPAGKANQPKPKKRGR
jgi:hypothetical protein